jgi:hypothetical protein
MLATTLRSVPENPNPGGARSAHYYTPFSLHTQRTHYTYNVLTVLIMYLLHSVVL